jgi:hypothetical protein
MQKTIAGVNVRLQKHANQAPSLVARGVFLLFLETHRSIAWYKMTKSTQHP